MSAEEKVTELEGTAENEKGKKGFVCDGAELLLLLLAAVFGNLAVRLWSNCNGGLTAVILCVMVYAVSLLYCKKAHIHLTWNTDTAVLSALVVGLLLPYVLFDLSADKSLLLFAALTLTSAMQLYSMLGARRYRFSEKNYVQDWVDAIFVMPFANLGAGWMTVGKAGKRGIGRNILLALLGFIIAIPLLAILLSLLFEADIAFSNMLRECVERFAESVSEEISYLLFGIPVAMIAFGILYGLRYRNGLQKAQAPGTKRSRIIPASIAWGVLVPVVIIYLAYLVSQLAYFTSAFQGLLPARFTYAEYARRGFFELCAVCVINMSLTVALLAFVKAGRYFRKLFGSFFCLISLFLSATSIAKLILYMQSYGLTTLRLYTSFFVVVLALTFVYILLRLYCEKLPMVQLLAVTFAGAMLVFAYTDAEAVALNYNVQSVQNLSLEDSAYFAGFSEEELLYMSDGIEPILRENRQNERVRKLISERQAMRAARDWSCWNLQSAHVTIG